MSERQFLEPIMASRMATLQLLLYCEDSEDSKKRTNPQIIARKFGYTHAEINSMKYSDWEAFLKAQVADREADLRQALGEVMTSLFNYRLNQVKDAFLQRVTVPMAQNIADTITTLLEGFCGQRTESGLVQPAQDQGPRG